MGYTVDKKTGKLILVHDVTVSSKAVNQPETQQQQSQRQQEQQTTATLPAIPAASMSSARASAPGTFVFPVTKQKVRTVWHEGNIWFVAKDVAECLGFTHPQSAIIDHCNHAKVLKGGETPLLTSSPRGINIIPESDVYRLVMRSKLPAAEQFQTWVCEEVLPAIRKTGGYGVVVPAPSAPANTEDPLILEAMQVLLSRTETLKAELAEAKPKADYYDALVDDRDLLTFTEAGKLFGMSARSLAAFLRDAKGTPHHWLFKGFHGANIPYQPIIPRGLMKVKHRTSSLNGMPCTQGYFTPKGVEALRRLLRG